MKKYGVLLALIVLLFTSGCYVDTDLAGIDTGDAISSRETAATTPTSESQTTAFQETTQSIPTTTPAPTESTKMPMENEPSATSTITTSTTETTTQGILKDIVEGYVFPDSEGLFVIQFGPTEKVDRVEITLENSSINSIDNADIFKWSDDRTVLTVTADLRIRNPDGSWTITIGRGYLVTIEGTDIVYDGTQWKKVN